MHKELKITLRHGTPAEERTRQVLHRLMEKYDLTGWIFTDRILVDETAMPHSHPTMTLNTEHEHNEAMSLAEFVHEQLHWFEEERSGIRDLAIEETRRYYPTVPTARPEGSGNEQSTRLHLLVCSLEYHALRLLMGGRPARRTIAALSKHHYCWVYRTVLKDQPSLDKIIGKFDFLPEPLQATFRHSGRRRFPAPPCGGAGQFCCG